MQSAGGIHDKHVGFSGSGSLAGVVYNWFPDADPRIDADSFETTRRALVRLGFPPAVVRVPRVPAGGPYPDVDFSPIFRPDDGS